jgi:hypothetical protein
MNAAYTVQALESLSASLDARYFLRSDVTTYTNPYLKNGEKKALGAELYASIIWVPMVDVSFVAGCGAFFPGMGNALNSGAPVLWKSTLSLLLSF